MSIETYMFFVVLFLFVNFFFVVSINEITKVIVGMLLGYNFNSCQFFCFNFHYDYAEVLVVSYTKNDFYFGVRATLIPPTTQTRMIYLFYELSSVVSNASICFFATIICANLFFQQIAFLYFFTMLFVALLVFLFNIVPNERNPLNNGMKIKYLLSDKYVGKAIGCINLIENKLKSGVPLEQIDENCWQVPADANFSNYYLAYWGYYQFCYFDKRQEISKAKKSLDKLYKAIEKLPQFYRHVISAGAIKFYLIYFNDRKKAQTLRTPAFINEFIHINPLCFLQAEVTFQVYVEKNYLLALQVLEQFDYLLMGIVDATTLIEPDFSNKMRKHIVSSQYDDVNEYEVMYEVSEIG
jgi:hypothetical protein